MYHWAGSVIRCFTKVSIIAGRRSERSGSHFSDAAAITVSRYASSAETPGRRQLARALQERPSIEREFGLQWRCGRSHDAQELNSPDGTTISDVVFAISWTALGSTTASAWCNGE